MNTFDKQLSKEYLNDMTRWVHEANKKWWVCLECFGTGQFDEVKDYIKCDLCGGSGKASRNIGELLMLTVSELSEALEGHRKNLMDDKLPHRKMFEVELADTIIRIFDMAGGLGLDLGGAFVEKMAYNAKREDHKLEARMGEHGKKY
jgi:hypothetical protein